jgi:hypothetical protein
VTEFEEAVLEALIAIDEKCNRIERTLEAIKHEVAPGLSTAVTIKVTPGTPRPNE